MKIQTKKAVLGQNKGCHLYFNDNFEKCWPILIIPSLWRKPELNLPLPQKPVAHHLAKIVFDRTTLQQSY